MQNFQFFFPWEKLEKERKMKTKAFTLSFFFVMSKLCSRIHSQLNIHGILTAHKVFLFLKWRLYPQATIFGKTLFFCIFMVGFNYFDVHNVDQCDRLFGPFVHNHKQECPCSSNWSNMAFSATSPHTWQSSSILEDSKTTIHVDLFAEN